MKIVLFGVLIVCCFVQILSKLISSVVSDLKVKELEYMFPEEDAKQDASSMIHNYNNIKYTSKPFNETPTEFLSKHEESRLNNKKENNYDGHDNFPGNKGTTIPDNKDVGNTDIGISENSKLKNILNNYHYGYQRPNFNNDNLKQQLYNHLATKEEDLNNNMPGFVELSPNNKKRSIYQFRKSYDYLDSKDKNWDEDGNLLFKWRAPLWNGIHNDSVPFFLNNRGKMMRSYFQERKVAKQEKKSRKKRDTLAGYIQDPNMCKKYDENLKKMWSKLSVYLNSSNIHNKQAVHNIVVMVKAYLDHQDKYPTVDTEASTQVKRKYDKIGKVLKRIKKILGTDNATEKVKDLVLENFKPEYGDESECKEMNEGNLMSSIDLSYKNYLNNANCLGDYETGLLRGEALLRHGSQQNARIYNSYIKDRFIAEDVKGAKGLRSKVPLNQLYAYRSRFKPGFLRRNWSYPNKSLRNAGSPKTKSNIIKKNKRSPQKTDIHFDASCMKYAKSKFLITLRTSIERFMDLRDCQRDDTLRMSNNNKELQRNPYLSKRRPYRSLVDNENTMTTAQYRNIDNSDGKIIFYINNNPFKGTNLNLSPEQTKKLTFLQTLEKITRTSNSKHSAKFKFDKVFKSSLDNSSKNLKNRSYSGVNQFPPANENDNLDIYQIVKKYIQQNDRNLKQHDKTYVRDKKISSSDDNSTNSDAAINEMATFKAVSDILNKIHEASLQNSKVDLSSVTSENNNGYVELSYLVKYPKSIIYHPQYLIKHILRYDDFVKVASKLYVNNDKRQLLKIVRYLPNNNTQVLFDTHDFKSPLQVIDNIDEEYTNTKDTENSRILNKTLRQYVNDDSHNNNFNNVQESRIPKENENGTDYKPIQLYNTNSRNNYTQTLLNMNEHPTDTILKASQGIDMLEENTSSVNRTPTGTIQKDKYDKYRVKPLNQKKFNMTN